MTSVPPTSISSSTLDTIAIPTSTESPDITAVVSESVSTVEETTSSSSTEETGPTSSADGYIAWEHKVQFESGARYQFSFWYYSLIINSNDSAHPEKQDKTLQQF